MQTTLVDIPATSEKVDTTVNSSTLIQSEAHADYLWRHSPAGIIQSQIEKKLAEEKEEKELLQEEFEYLQQFKEFRPKQRYLRVGKQ